MIKAGDMPLMVSTRDNEPIVKIVRVERVDPLVLLVPGNGDSYEPEVGEAVNFILRTPHGDAHSAGQVRSVTKYGMSFVIEVQPSVWQPFDKRRAERYGVAINGHVVQVDENAGEILIASAACEITDVSKLGCHIICDQPLARGSLVAISTDDPNGGEPWRFLGIVTRGTDTGYGIEFFDYFGSTRYRLDVFLSSLREAA
jgi:hypothetical protein